MNKFEPPDCHFYSAAVGWLELGNMTEAKLELARLSPALQNVPEVLEVRWLIFSAEKNWEEALVAADELVKCSPARSWGWLHRAYALRRVASGGLRKAWEALLPAAEKFPAEAIIPFNLACYACQMQELDTALSWLQKAMAIDKRATIKAMALQDPDLQPLWTQIKLL